MTRLCRKVSRCLVSSTRAAAPRLVIRRRRTIPAALVLALTHLGPAPIGLAPPVLGAQQQTPAGDAAPRPARAPAAWWGWLYRFDSDSADRARLAHLVADAPTAGFLLRSPSSATRPVEAGAPEARGRELVWRPLAPVAGLVFNTPLPLSLNDGALRAGAGPNLRLAAGVEARWRRVRVILAPELLLEVNAGFDLADTGTVRAPSLRGDRSPYSSPWHGPPTSIDLPLRFGDEGGARLDAGQSSIAVRLGAVEVGGATENHWWGPGVRNALVLSNNAGGFPHLFVRSARPLATPVGAVEFRYVFGGLAESAFFDTVSANDRRAYAALAATVQPRGVDGLTLGVARAVYASVDPGASLFGHLLDPLASVPASETGASPDSLPGGREQLVALFGRWVFPASGVEAYAELARAAAPRSVRDLLVAPNHSRGHTFGVQWAGPARPSGGRWRLQAEHTNVERAPSRAYRPAGSFYTSGRVAQGYTHDGQVLGAAIGPGSSAQWVAADRLGQRWSLGATFMRVRWNNDAHNDRPWRPDQGSCEHDVTLLPGVRASRRDERGTIAGYLQVGTRMNVFFDNGGWCPSTPFPRDERVVSLALTFEPRR